MKVEKSLKIILIILLIVLISLISFVGIFVQKGNRVNNILPEFKLGTDLTGSRHISIQPSKEKEKVIYDENGQVVEEEGEKTTTEEVAVNPEEVLTKENYEKSKQIIIERLEKITEGLEEIQKINQVLITKKVVDDFIIKVDEANGGIFYQIPENEYTDLLVQILSLKGEFNVVNEEGEELLSHSDLKEALIGYGTTETGTTVYLSLELTEDGANKLKEISKTYVHSTDEEGNETSKNVLVRIDESVLLETHFEEEATEGVMQLAIGSQSTSSSEISSYAQEASNIAVLLNNGPLPITYTVEENRYVISDVSDDSYFITAIVVISLLGVAILGLIIKYGKNGLLSAISFIGYVGTLLIVIRFTNTVVTISGAFGILTGIILNFVFVIYLSHTLKKAKAETQIEVSKTCTQSILRYVLILIPAIVTVIIFSFISWQPIYSFGITLVWGIALIVLFNFLITKSLISLTNKKCLN